MKQKCAMLLPDQTYEQCQAILTPILAIRKILQDSRLNAATSTASDGKQEDRINGLRSKKAASGKHRKVETDGENNAGSKVRDATPENFVKTSEFFNNIPDYTGAPIGPFGMTYEPEGSDGKFGRNVNKTADLLKECEEFLHTHRIRPDFFCRYRKAIK